MRHRHWWEITLDWMLSEIYAIAFEFINRNVLRHIFNMIWMLLCFVVMCLYRLHSFGLKWKWCSCQPVACEALHNFYGDRSLQTFPSSSLDVPDEYFQLSLILMSRCYWLHHTHSNTHTHIHRIKIMRSVFFSLFYSNLNSCDVPLAIICRRVLLLLNV